MRSTSIAPELRANAFDDLTAQLAWHGVKVECRLLRHAETDAASQLTNLGAPIGAEMIVIGGYEHRPLREAIFGGVSQALIEHATVPVFLMH